ncbi:type II toxin-antitoxin system VapB family antitoxin [Mobilicoccus caccae]|uniref:Antitoxin VapB30 n=1 Tax=Mobilicoccus caccae TaxID=1859295 RepID=A0ABQ6IVR6_9MICO|nr:type II toxin-antitoxin system VapB family antitoxin [Mobilicoccus caccae]GMA41460.1 antitoxin VapB30 [Mobilicoccus caccae]
MSLNIKDAETDRLARELSRISGESLTVATRIAIEERLERIRHARRRSTRRDDILGIIETGRAERDLDPRSDEQILGYDEHGLPT